MSKENSDIPVYMMHSAYVLINDDFFLRDFLSNDNIPEPVYLVHQLLSGFNLPLL
jgi:hypothetical protein